MRFYFFNIRLCLFYELYDMILRDHREALLYKLFEARGITLDLAHHRDVEDQYLVADFCILENLVHKFFVLALCSQEFVRMLLQFLDPKHLSREIFSQDDEEQLLVQLVLG